MAEFIEQERLKKLPGYKFLWVLDTLTSIVWWGFFFWALYAAGQRWGATFMLNAFICVLVYFLRRPIIRRTQAQHSLEYQDKQASK